MSKKKKIGKMLAAGLAAYGASKMMGGKEEAPMRMMGGKGTGDALQAENIANFQRGLDKIAAAGGVSRLNKGSKNVVTAKCKLGRNKPTKLS
jgi:hypothetical protein